MMLACPMANRIFDHIDQCVPNPRHAVTFEESRLTACIFIRLLYVCHFSHRSPEEEWKHLFPVGSRRWARRGWEVWWRDGCECRDRVLLASFTVARFSWVSSSCLLGSKERPILLAF